MNKRMAELQDPIDPDEFEATCELAPIRKSAVRPRDWFLSPKISLDWVQRAAKLPGRSLHLANALLHLSQLCKSAEFRLQPSMLLQFSVGRKAGYRCLGFLVAAGLVAIVDRAAGRAATVRLIRVGGAEPDK